MPSLAQQPGPNGDAAPREAHRGGVSLLFAPGERPSADDVSGLLDAPEAGLAACVVHHPPAGEGGLEILASGLTFDLRGLAPAMAATPVIADHHYGFADVDALVGAEAIELAPSGHIAAGAGLQPVVRAMAGLAAALALRLSARAVGWVPAGTLMEPRYFSRVVLGWLGGGPFPALGLTALVPAEDGGVSSFGLAHFIGREIRLEPRAGESRSEAVKLAIRVVDELVRHGAPTTPGMISAGAESLLMEPSQVGRLIWVWRQAG